MRRVKGLGIALAAVSLAGCGDESGPAPTPAPPLPWPAAAMPAAPEPDDNPGTPEKIELGRLLFYDPILSTDRRVACATCHSEIWGMSDGLGRSIGVGGTGPTGPGRVGPNLTRRNAPTLWNTAYLVRVFDDGRAPSLEAQVLGPLHTPEELGRDPRELVADLTHIPDYARRFAAAFPDDAPAVTLMNLQRAVAAFERSLVSDHAPYDHYLAGDPGALSEGAQRGMYLFAGLGCAGCHAPPLFGSAAYANRGVDPVPGVDDQGLFEVTGDARDRGAFRVPTLRNVRETGPYFHTGAEATLLGAVRHEAGLAPRAVSDAEIADLVTFLDKALIDPSGSPARPSQVPSGLPVPVDGFRIPR